MDFIFSQVFTDLHPDTPIEETLEEYGSRIVRLALSEGQIALLRVVTMESIRFPEPGERFYELGPKRGLITLGRYMERQIKHGRPRKEDPTLMAEHFISLFTGGPVRWVVLGLQRSSIIKNGQQRLDAAVRVFMRAYSA